MIKFIQESTKEIEHVVWPTKAETKKYFTIVTAMIVIWATLLAVFGFAVTESMFAIRKITPHDVAVSKPTEESSSLLKKIENAQMEKSATVSGSSSPKNTVGSGSTK